MADDIHILKFDGYAAGRETENIIEKTTDKNGNNILPSGTSYTVEVNFTINGLYTVTLVAGEETIEKTIRVSSLYAQDFWIDYYVTEEYALSQEYESLQELLDDWKI